MIKAGLVPVIPIMLVVWLTLIAVTAIAMPEQTVLLVALSGVLGLGLAVFMFPGAALVLGIASTMLSVENFRFFHDFNQQFPTFLAQSSFHKVISIALMMPAILRYGIKPKSNPVIFAFLIMFASTFVFASRLPGLDDAQVVQTLVGLTMPYLVFNMRLQERWIPSHLAIIASIPLLSLVLGYMAQFAGLYSWVGELWQAFSEEDRTGAYRLRGINIAAGLAAISYIGFFICIFQAVLYRKNGYYVLAGVLVMITVLTGTRGPLAAELVFAGLGILIASNRDMRASAKLNFGIVGAILLGIILIAYWPNLEARFAPSAGGDEVINTSARSDIWELEYEGWQENPVFGRGLGAGAIFLLDNEWKNLAGARATHNEFLRLLLDGGILGLGAYLIGLIMLIASECRGVSQTTKRLTFAFFVSFALYSFTDNTISSPATLITFYALALMLFQARLSAQAQAARAPARHQAYYA